MSGTSSTRDETTAVNRPGFFFPKTETNRSSGGRSLQKHAHVRQVNAFTLGLIALGAAMNVSIGYLVNMFKLPLYLDSIGTVLISVLCGWTYGIVVGLSALIILSLTAVPTVLAYAGTAITIAIVSAFLGRFGFLKKPAMTVIGGIVIGLAATAASVPVTTLLYGGVSLAGSDAITTVFKATGLPVWQSVLLGSLITDTVDKFITALICMMMIRSLPKTLLSRFPGTKDFKGV